MAAQNWRIDDPTALTEVIMVRKKSSALSPAGNACNPMLRLGGSTFCINSIKKWLFHQEYSVPLIVFRISP